MHSVETDHNKKGDTASVAQLQAMSNVVRHGSVRQKRLSTLQII